MTNIENLLEKIIAISDNDNDIVLKVNNVRHENFSPESLNGLADLLLGKAYYEYADKICDHVLEVSSSSSHALYNKGFALLSMGHYEGSLSMFQSVINLKQGYVADAYANSATASAYLDRPNDAKRFYALAAEEYSSIIKELTEEVLSSQRKGDFKQSLKPLEQILTIEPNNRYGLYLKALALYKLNQYKESIPVFEKYIDLDRNNVQVLSYLGNAYSSIGQYEKAIKRFDDVIFIKQKAGADDADSRYYKGTALLSVERFKEAEEEYKKALQLYEKTLGTEKKIILTLEKLHSIYSNYPDYFNFEEALKISKKIADLDKNNQRRFKLMLAEDFIKTNNITDCKKILEEIYRFHSSEDGNYKKIQEFLMLCSNFLDLNELNDQRGMDNFYKFFSSSDYDDSEIDSDFWNFNGIRHVIQESKMSENKKQILLQLIDSFQNKEKRRIAKDSIGFYFSSVAEELRKQNLKTKGQNKKIKQIVIFVTMGFFALLGLVIVYVGTMYYDEYPQIIVPQNTVDWTVDSENEKLYYITNEKDKTREGEFKGKFVEYDIKRDKSDNIRSHLSSISGENPLINGFLDIFFPFAEPLTKPPIGIDANPSKLIHDDKRGLTFITLENEKELIIIKNGEPIILPFNGFPKDVKFDDNFIYVSSHKPNELSVFDSNFFENKYKTPIKPIKTLSLKYVPDSLLLDESNHWLYFINSDSSELSFINLKSNTNYLDSSSSSNASSQPINLTQSDIEKLKETDVKYIELWEQRFLPGATLFDDNTKKLIVQNYYTKDLIILPAKDPELLWKSSQEGKKSFDYLKELFPLRSHLVYMDDGIDNSVFISTPGTKNIYKLVFGEKGTSKEIYQISYNNITNKPGSNNKLIFDEKTKKMLVMDSTKYTIGRIDLDVLNKTGEYIDVERNPFAMKFDNANSLLYVVNQYDDSISIVDTYKNMAVKNIPVGPHCGPNDSISIVDGDKNISISGTSCGLISGPYYPNDVAFDDKEKKVFVVNSHYNVSDIPYPSYDNDSSILIIYNTTKESLENDKKINPTKFVLLKNLMGSSSIGVNPMNKKIYVSNPFNNTVSVLDYDGNILNKIKVGEFPVDIEVNPERNLVYVTNNIENTLSIVNSTTDIVIENLVVGHGPNYIAVHNKNQISVVNTLSDTVSIIDIFDKPNNHSYHKVINTILLRKDSLSPAFPISSDYYKQGNRGFLFVINSDNRISIIDPDRTNIFPITEIPVQVSRSLDLDMVYAIALDHKTANIYISSPEYDMLFKYDGKKYLQEGKNYYPVKSIQTGNFPYGIRIDQFSGNAYVPNLKSEFVEVFAKNNTDLFKIKVPDISYFDIDQSTGNLYVSHKHSGNISIYSYNFLTNNYTNKESIHIDNPPSSILIDENYRLLVTGNNSLMAYDLPYYNTSNQVDMGLGANLIALDEIYNFIYAIDPIENEYSIINGSDFQPLGKYLHNIPVLGNSPSSVVVNQKTGDVYISNRNSDTVEMIKPDGSIIQIAVGNSPVGMSINQEKNRLYVLNEKSHDVYIIDLASNKILKIIKVGYYPNSIDVDFKTDNIYVTSGYTNNIFKFHDDTIDKPLFVFDEHKKILVNLYSDELTIKNLTNTDGNWSLKLPFIGKDILSDSKNIYVSSLSYDQNSGNSSIFKISLTDKNIADELRINYYPSIMALDPDHDRLYVLDDNKKKIGVIDTNKFEIIPDAEIPFTRDKIKSLISVDSMEIDYSSKETIIYLLDKESGIFVLDADNKNITSIISQEQLHGSPDYLKVNPKTHKVYGTLDFGSSVFVIKNDIPDKISIPPNNHIGNIIFQDDGTLILTSDLKSVIFLDGKDLIRYYGYIPDLAIDTEIYDDTIKIFFDTEMNKIYMANGLGEDLTIVEKNMSIIPALGNIVLDSLPVYEYFDPNLNRLYVAETDPSLGNSSISIIDVNTNKKLPDKILINGKPRSIAFDPNLNRLYVAETDPSLGNSSILIIDVNTNKKLPDKILINGSFINMKIYPELNRLYVAEETDPSLGNSSISIIDVNTNKKLPDKILINGKPRSIAFDPNLNRLYVAEETDPSLGNSSISIIDVNTNKKLPDKILINGKPRSIAFDPNLNRLYVAEETDPSLGNSSISIIDVNTNKKLPANIDLGNQYYYYMKIEPTTHKFYGLYKDLLNQEYYFYILDYHNPSSNQTIFLPWIKGQSFLIQIDSKTNKLYVGEYQNTNNIWIIDPLKLEKSIEIKTNIARKN